MHPQLNHLLHLSVEAIQGNHLDLAERYLKQVLLVDARQPDALRFLGVVAALRGNWELALELINKVIKISPKSGIAYSNKGNVLRELGRPEEALKSYNKAIELEPSYLESYSNKGNVLQDLKRFGEALVWYDKAIAKNQVYADAYVNKANCLRLMEHHVEALQCYERALQVRSDLAPAYIGAALSLQKLRRFLEAQNCFNQALKIDGTNSAAWFGAGEIKSLQLDFEGAQLCYQKALECDPNNGFALGMLLNSSLQTCNYLAQEKYLPLAMDWINKGREGISPYMAIATSDDPELIERTALIFSSELRKINPTAFDTKSKRKEKIQLAYFSADFHNHPTAYLSAGLFECHDKSKFELTAFVIGGNESDSMRERLVGAFDRFIDVSNESDEEIVRLARSINVDIAIDLKGFTEESRPAIFAHRVAPVQVSYLGYPGTMGIPSMDYIIADNIVIPRGSEKHYSEKIVYMPNTYQVNDRNREVPEEQYTRAELGLPQKGFIFCGFNNNYKITSDVFKSWLRIIKRVEGSVLWLFEGNPLVAENLKSFAKECGVDPSRLIFGQRLANKEHMSRYHAADLFLDTFPCNAHTTASDALWMGLPVLTREGNTFSGRVASSLLHAIGLPELVVTTEEGYEELAIDLASNQERLGLIKEKLKNSRMTAPLFDTLQFTRDMESAYSNMMERNWGNMPPEHIHIMGSAS